MDKDQRKEHPADLADQLERLSVEEAQQELRDLPPSEGAAVLAEIEEHARPAVLENLAPTEIANLVQKLPHNEAADIISSLPADVQPAVLGHLPASDRKQVSEILSYAPESAGGIMSDRFISLREHLTIGEAQRALQGRAEEPGAQQVAYMYVVDAGGRLKGILSIHDLVFRQPHRRISEIMKPDVKHVWVDDDQEKIAQLFEHYHYMALPVLDRAGKLVGLVQANQVVEVVRREATEDMQLMVGLSGEERALTPWFLSMKRRLPWLCINLGTAFLAAAVVGIFEETIAAWTALAIFLPIVAGQGGNAGAQTLTVIIRDMALGEISKGDGRKALLKETWLGLLNGIVIGVIVGLISYAWKGSFALGIVVAVAMVLNMVAAGLSGVLVPYTLRALRIDPALASSIIMTTVTDVAGFFFFLGLAALARG
ncbi:MAG TPA: magnesium transporter [Candidatus Kapabacteria bacterium]|jgi:magnesium transporter|nr:magnesium transporter [Candidatus Kapabacteria bacterium]